MAPALPAAGCHGRTLGGTEEGQGEGDARPTYTGRLPPLTPICVLGLCNSGNQSPYAAVQA